MRVSYWSQRRQWQWVEDYCHWLEDGYSPLQAAHAIFMSAKQYHLRQEQQLALRLQHCLQRGQPLVHGLKGWLSSDLLQVFAIGQQSDCLTEVLQQYQAFQQRRRHFIGQCWKQRFYPLFVLLLVVVAMIGAGRQYFPALLERSALTVPPASVQWVMAISEWLQTFGGYGIVFLSLGSMLYYWAGRQWLSPVRFGLERWGVFAYQRSQSAVWTTQMTALLLKQGLSLRQLLERLQPLPSAYTRYHLRRMQSKLANGEQQLAKVMNTGLLPARLLFRLQNGGRAHSTVETLWRTALRSSEDTERWLQRRQKVLLGGLYSAIIGAIILLIQASGQLMMAVMSTVT